MKDKLFLTLFTTLTLTTPIMGASPLMMGSAQELQVVINNRILAVANGKPISVMDVMKKMDVGFYKQFAQYAESPAARFQFYQVNWKNTLQDLIDKELILAEAKEKKLPLSQGDVRQEMEKLFGPNIIENLDKIDLSYEEASEIIRGDILIRRMMYIMANSKAINQVTPKAIREAYEKFSQENVRPDEFEYRVISIRSKDTTESAEVANYAHNMLVKEKIPLDEVSEILEGSVLAGKSTTVNISDTYNHSEKEVSENYKKILDTLEQGSYSQPIAQKSRANNSLVFRIFYLNDKKHGGIIPFEEVEVQLKNQLTQQAVERETTKYLDKLHQHYNVKDSYLKQMMPEDFQPFMLQ